MTLAGIKSIKPTTSSELEEMTQEQLIELKAKLQPFYTYRSEILDEFGVEEWRKVLVYPWICRKIINQKISKSE